MSTSDSCKDGSPKSNNEGVRDVNDMLQRMSTTDKDNEDISYCANCGKGEEDSGNLKACTACKLVKYCNRECQIAHRSKHKKECRKRAAELRDIELFKQPPPAEDCPICFLRIPFLNSGWRYFSCCGKVICSGCSHAPVYDNQGNVVDNEKCPFCRTPKPTSDEEMIERYKKRMDANDPIATFNVGKYYADGKYGYPQDHSKAFKHWRRAAELGYVEAYSSIGYAFDKGEGVVEVDKKKARHYYELAAMGGNVLGRHNLGVNEAKAGNIDKSLKHFMIAAKSGHNESLKKIQELYPYGCVRKEDYTKALQSYQSYLNEIKSPQRDEAAAFDENCQYY